MIALQPSILHRLQARCTQWDQTLANVKVKEMGGCCSIYSSRGLDSYIFDRESDSRSKNATERCAYPACSKLLVDGHHTVPEAHGGGRR